MQTRRIALRLTALAAALNFIACTGYKNHENNPIISNENMETMKLTNEWDKIFPQSDKVDHRKVTFTNRYGKSASKIYESDRKTHFFLPQLHFQ